MPGFISGLRRSVQKNELQGKRPAVTKGTAGRFIILGTGWGRLPQSARSADSPIYSPNRNSKKWFRFGGEEGGCGYGAFAAPAEAEWSRLLFSFVKPKGNPTQWLPFGAEEGGCGYGAFAAPAETEWSRLLLTQRAVCCAWRLSGGSPSACEECAEMSGEGCRRFRGARAGERSPVGRYPAQSGGGWHLERAFCLCSRVGR